MWVVIPEMWILYGGPSRGFCSTQVKRLAASGARSAVASGTPWSGSQCCPFHAPTSPAHEWLMRKVAGTVWPDHLDCLVAECLFHSGCSLVVVNMHSKTIYPTPTPTDPPGISTLVPDLAFPSRPPTNPPSHLLRPGVYYLWPQAYSMSTQSG